MMHRLHGLIVYLLFITAVINSQPKETLLTAFNSASKKYNVPVEILKAVAYTETRFMHVIPDENTESENGAPPVYGIMGLRNDNWFGHSLADGARLIGYTSSETAADVSLNIMAAAALLSKYADDFKINRNDFNAWRPVLEKYSGIPQDDIKPFYSFDVFKVLSDGANVDGIEITKHAEINMAQFGENINPKNKLKNIQSTQSELSTDYPPAVWDPSPNYTTGSINQLFLVVHDTEGSFAGSVSWLKNPVAQASSHYIIRSSDGYVVQLVREQDKAWHVRCWNGYMIGVEHEGYVNNPAYFTEAMYQSSAALFRHLIQKFNIPLDRNRVIGHNQWQSSSWVSWMQTNYPAINPTCNNHTDPGPYWNWDHFFNLIASGAAAPKVMWSTPSSIADTVWNNTPIKISFDQAMTALATQNAFSISPAVNGSFTWQDNGKTLVFTPAGFYPSSVTYTVTVSTSALSTLNTQLDSAYTFQFVSKPAVPVTVLKSYPADGQLDVSTTVKVLCTFYPPLIKNTLGGNVSLFDIDNNKLNYKNATYTQINNKGVVSFSPTAVLKNDANYKIIFGAGIKSIAGTTLGSDFIINFKTVKDNFIKGTVVDSFETIGSWKDPDINNGSISINQDFSSFLLAYGTNTDGQYSGKISYVFTGEDGLCKVNNSDKPDLGSDNKNNFGIWVFGDFSGNQFELWFDRGAQQNIAVNACTLDFTGWKFVQVPFDKISGTGSIKLNGIAVKKLSGGADSSFVFVDEAQLGATITSISADNNLIVPSQFRLGQNYPNPFNPSTKIRYSIPELHNNENPFIFVQLKVYDILGSKVAVLINKEQPAGEYEVEFNASYLTSGIYFYKLTAGSFTAVKKLILMK